MSFELLENGETVTKGGLGGAVAGGLLLGGVGAVVGSVVSKKSSGVCTSMSIRITVKNSHIDATYIQLLGTKTKTSSIVYTAAKRSAQSYLSALEIIADIRDIDSNKSMPSDDTATEIQKFFDLKEKGIITEEEFSAKKAQLLGL